MMLGRAKALGILRLAIESASADSSEAVLIVWESSLTRFANSIIHQNVSETNAQLSVRAVVGKRVGYASTNRLDENSIREVAAKASEFARRTNENPDFVSLPRPSPIPQVESYDEKTALLSPEERAKAVGGMIGEASRMGASAAGTFSNGYHEVAILNSHGVEAYEVSSKAHVTTVMTADTGNGYADRLSRRVSEIDPIAAALEAAAKSVAGRDPQSVEPGEYDVVLLPYAVNELMEFLAWLGLGALSVQEGRSFMGGKFGEKITGENISIWDDGLDPSGLPTAFDGEGVPKQRVDLITDGVANAVVYDTYTANKEGKKSTGHFSGGTGIWGPMPQNLFMRPGTSSIEEMIAGTKRGILVTRFHYTNVIHPMLTIITGMTRDGTFLIENGHISRPLKNLRFTDNILERLSHVEAISAETMRQPFGVFPALKCLGFKFTGVTEF